MKSDARNLVSTRWSLVQRLKEWGDDESWQDFFDTYWKLIYSVALRAGCTSVEAQDVVQETVLTVAKKMQEFKADPALGSFRGWLCMITRRRVADQLRKRQPAALLREHRSRETGRTSTTNQIPSQAEPTLEDYWHEEWQNHLMELALDRVKARANARQYQIFDLHVVKKLPADRVAQGMGIKVADVHLAKHRVTALIKKEVSRLQRLMI